MDAARVNAGAGGRVEPGMHTRLRIHRLMAAGVDALPDALKGAAQAPGSDLYFLLSAIAAMVAQAMTELTTPPEGYEIGEESCSDGDSPDAAGDGGAPPTTYWLEYTFSGNGERSSGYLSHSLACCAAWDHSSEMLSE